MARSVSTPRRPGSLQRWPLFFARRPCLVRRDERLRVLARVALRVAVHDVVAERWRCTFCQSGDQLQRHHRRPVGRSRLRGGCRDLAGIADLTATGA